MREVEVPNWLKGLPLAPEFHPSDTEFADPIAYISKIEKEASAFGICKVIPPLPKPAKKYVLANLNKSLLKCPELGDDVGSLSKLDNKDKEDSRAVFTTRQQELGLSGKKAKGSAGGALQLPAAHKQVWQSGEIYTLEQFESKSKNFARSQLGTIKEASPEVIEALFWKAANEKPIYIEYANDVPGSGFGEPEESLRSFHNRRRRRRKRGTFSRNNRECSEFKEDQVVKLSNSVEKNVELNASCAKSSIEISQADTSSSNMLSDQMSQGPRQRDSNSAGNEMEGTSGWKLSNSPWNLQVIARSPGSLTRFMPDDIPGVTSPMIYIGMLFSWFAWHVEDHELHSLNFLHTGSPKTWYSIPGDYAFTFEEVIRSKAYGGKIDRLAALTLLGEKTTLLSPEVVVASGIPCCRLVQNPGEFVVTFPRAYHIGFSHGFNCGEAANFGTPKWLTVAKEAAVRRAAMNHLPMLSHQQLLYLLTMSFISRVPRSLLPGVRSSRLRDRQKEERELLVKKAFVEDILNENKLLTNLLRKNSSYHAVSWDLESLPSTGKESDLCSSIDDGIITSPIKKVHYENNKKKDLCGEMNLYAEAMDDPYVGDDMSGDFQVDSGTLPCVACGVLGFPFMSIIQPYEKTAPDAVTTDHHVVQGLEIPNTMESYFPSDLNNMAEVSISEGLGIHNKLLEDDTCSDNLNRAYSNTESIHAKLKFLGEEDLLSDISTTVKDPPDSTEVKFDKRWITNSGYLRPRIFCLEHASQTEELLQSRGGAKVLVICHSDFQKVKAHAAAVVEQIGSPFRYNEIPLDIASQDDLKLINLAIDDEEQAEHGEDWTTKLNINLRQCVKLGNKSSSKKVQHALTLEGLFADTASHAGSLILNWHARKSRSKKKVNGNDHNKPPRSLLVQKDEVMEAKSDTNLARKGGCLIRYSRRRFFKSKIGGSVTNRGKTEIEGNSSPELVLGSIEISQAHCENVENAKEQTQNHTLQEILMRDEVCDSSKDDFHLQNEIKNIAEISNGQKDRSSETSADSHPIANYSIGCSKIGISMATEAKNDIGQSDVQDTGARNYVIPQFDFPEQSETQHENVENIKGQTENLTMREMLIRDEVSGSTKDDFQVQNDFNSAAEKSSKQKDGCCSEDTAALLPVANGSITIIENSEIGISMMTEVENDSGGSCAEEPGLRSFDEQMEERCLDCVNGNDREQQRAQTTNRSTENNSVPSVVCVMNESAPDSLTENLEVPKEACTTMEMDSNSEDCSLLKYSSHTRSTSKSSSINRSKRKREVALQHGEHFVIDEFIKSPCERLRPRGGKNASRNEINLGRTEKLEGKLAKRVKKPAAGSSIVNKDKKQHKKGSHKCDVEGCKLSFQTKAELALHRRNKCPHDGCRKQFRSHSYAVLHLRVHEDDRPLKCSWKGCTMTFKWAWARTEHLRVHTGEKPYECKIKGCGLKFRFLSDFSRHRRKTGHYVEVPT